MRVDWDASIPKTQRQQCADWIRGHAEWTWWATLTFKYSISRDAAVRAFKEWLRTVAVGVIGDHVKVAWSVEGSERDHTHLHLVMALPPTTNRRQIRTIESLWRGADSRAGFTSFEPYNPSLNGVLYLLKGNDWDVSVGCPRRPECRKKNGCRVLPGPY